MASRIYTPLDPSKEEFRLLSLGPRYPAGKDELTKIYCDLYKASRTGKSVYQALSYTWEGETVPTIINREKLPTTQNLHTALEHIGNEIMVTTLWIDAICIN